MLEIKRPGDDDLEAASKHAIGYATALHQEANEDESTRDAYRKAFGSGGNAPLAFGAVALMAYNKEKLKAWGKLLERFVPKGTGKQALTERVGIVVYKWHSGKIGDCSWLDTEGHLHSSPHFIERSM